MSAEDRPQEQSSARSNSQPYSAQTPRSSYGLTRLENSMLGFGRSLSSSSPVDSEDSTPSSTAPSTPFSPSTDSFDTPIALNGVFFSRPLPPSRTNSSPNVVHELEQAQAVLRGMFEELPTFGNTSNEAADRTSSLITTSTYRRPRVMSVSSVQSSESTFSSTPPSRGYNYGSFTSEGSFFPPAPTPLPISLPVSPPRDRVDSGLSSSAPSVISSRMSILNEPHERHAHSTFLHDNNTFHTPHPVTPRHRADSMEPTQRSRSAAPEHRPTPPTRSSSSASNPVYTERRASPQTDSGSPYSRRPLPAPPIAIQSHPTPSWTTQQNTAINDIQFPASRSHSSSPTNMYASSSRPADNVVPQTRERKSSSGRTSPPGATQGGRTRKESTDNRSAASYYATPATRSPTRGQDQPAPTSSFSASRRQRRHSTSDHAPTRLSLAGIQETAIAAIYEEPIRERQPSMINQAEPRRRNSDGERNSGSRLYRRESQKTQGVRWDANLICPSPILPSQRRQGWYNRRGCVYNVIDNGGVLMWMLLYRDQLWTNTGAYKPPSPGSEYPPDLADYPRYGEGWMNEDGTRIDMEHHLIPKVPLRSALKQ